MALPNAVHGLLVDSLFRDSRSLLIGSATTILAIVVSAAKTGSWPILACGLALIALVPARIVLIRIYDSHPRLPFTPGEAERWELLYSVGAGLHCLLLGLWCLLTLTLTADSFAQVLSAVVTIGCASAIPGRNFGRVGLATVQILALCVPLCVGWLCQMTWYYAFLVAVTVPFFAALRIMSVRLQATLLEALTANNKLGTLAERFDAALTNMPVGLCMLDASRAIEVYNPRLTEVLGLAAPAGLYGSDLPGLLRRDDGREPSSRLAGHPVDGLEALLKARDSGTISMRTADSRTVTLTTQPMASGGTVVLVEDVTRRRQAETKILRLARFDSVTETANRAYFLEQMEVRFEESQRLGARSALYFIDLDRFKIVNDTLGHACGDRLLREVARRLHGIVGASGLVGRFGGDEFVVFEASVEQESIVAALATDMIDALGKPFLIDGQMVKIAGSIGVAMAPDHGTDPDLLLQRADMALYRAKSAGRGRWRFFEPAMDLEVLERRRLELDLSAGLENWAFDIHYQPLVRLDTMRVGTCEALLRWMHPERGMVSPADFIPIAEEVGLITEIGARVLRLACEECGTWPDGTNVSVNLSPVQFQKCDIVAVIDEALRVTGLAAERLEVEITESVLLQNTKATRDALKDIRDLGVTLVLDDFGTGHSSLSYLHSFPLQKIKLDRSFLGDVLESERSRILLESVGTLSQRLGLSVVIEGVESDAQLALIRSMTQIDEVQGYFFGHPIPAPRIRDMLAGWSPAAWDHPGNPRRSQARGLGTGKLRTVA